MTSTFDDIDRCRQHPRYNPKTLRVELTREEIEALPIKVASKHEIWGAMRGMFFTPELLYPRGFAPLKGEVGHDDLFRYVREDLNGERAIR